MEEEMLHQGGCLQRPEGTGEVSTELASSVSCKQPGRPESFILSLTLECKLNATQLPRDMLCSYFMLINNFGPCF